jgi:hypothetical protein
MNTLEKTYKILIENDLARDGFDFSLRWAGKGQGWFAYQIYKKRDFSTDAAFHTLGKARDMKSKLLPKQKQLGFLVEDSIRAVEQVERLICDYLYEKHNITECVLAADIAINTSTNCLVGKARNDFY